MQKNLGLFITQYTTGTCSVGPTNKIDFCNLKICQKTVLNKIRININAVKPVQVI